MSDTQSIFTDIIDQRPVPTGIGQRIAAALIDAIILFAVLFLLGMLLGKRYTDTTTTVTTTITSTDGATSPQTTTREETTGFKLEGWPAFLYMVCWFCLMPLLEGLRGQTIGKMAVRIKVVRRNGDPVNVGLSLVRHLFDIVDCFFLIGIIIAATNPNKARIGDLVAGTCVVDKK